MKPEVFRLSGGLRWLIAVTLGAIIGISLAALCGLMEASRGVPMPWAMRLQIPAFLGTPCAIGILGAWRSRIVADERGLRWRGLGGEKVVTWDQVEDYFITFSRFGQSASRTYIVRFRNGRKISFDYSLEEFRFLEKIIAERATNAKAKGWLIRSKEGTLSGKIVAAYTEKEHRKNFWIVVATVALCGLGGALFPTLTDKSGAHPPSWSGVVFVAVGLFIATFGIRSQRFCRGFLGQRVEADERGFTLFLPSGESRQCSWRQINSVSPLRQMRFKDGSPIGWSLETDTETFAFLLDMKNGHLLAAMIRQYAPQAFALTQPAPARDALAPTEKTDGKRTFHYRTRYNRALLSIALGFALAIWALGGYFFWRNSHQTPEELEIPFRFPDTLLFWMGGFFFVLWLWSLWRYKSARLVLDGEVVTQYGLRGVQRVGYEEIGRLGIAETLFLETHDGRRPIQWFLNIADAHELRLELEKRTGLRFLSAETVEQAENPPKQPDDVQQKLEGGHAGR